MIFKCEEFCKTKLAKDLIPCAERLIKQAEAPLSMNLSTASQELPEKNQVECYSFKILSIQPDFAIEKPMLRQVIQDSGHMSMFLKKFHCKPNPIELLWCYVKEDKCCKFFAVHF